MEPFENSITWKAWPCRLEFLVRILVECVQALLPWVRAIVIVHEYNFNHIIVLEDAWVGMDAVYQRIGDVL